MTIEQKMSLKAGDKVELLDLSLQPSGKVLTVKSVTRANGGTVYFKEQKHGVSNEKRLGFVSSVAIKGA